MIFRNRLPSPDDVAGALRRLSRIAALRGDGLASTALADAARQASGLDPKALKAALIPGLVRETVRYSLDHRGAALEYALRFARGMDPGIADRFVGMWVNDMTLDAGPRGKHAVQELLDRGHAAGVIPQRVAVDFVDA